ncbi:MAG: DNA gyrase inhibitor YacG [Proteobacteria bacterium]|nr:DNA gyrase inhibitor YacG [Pseudomonadota bacterium]
MEVSCPTCRAKVVWETSNYRPFCSERCKLIDLGRWLNEEYRVCDADAESESAGGGSLPNVAEPSFPARGINRRRSD